ncbi:MAG: hypothetical protein IK088_02470, partial [Lachnospiraceae bacterium]|nr:hypothetical protein [Lachnospiraceae bacterium]
MFFLAGIVLVYLFLLSGFSTTIVGTDESVYFVKDSIILNLLFLILLFAALYFGGKLPRIRSFFERIDREEAYSAKVRRILLFILFGLSVFLVLVFQNKSVTDQHELYMAAEAFADGNFRYLDAEKYLGWNPHQLGMVWILYLLSFVFGSFNYLVFQFLNCFALCSFYRSLSELSDYAGQKKRSGALILLLGILFLPAVFYTTYVYGILLGLSLSLAGTVRALRLTEEFRLKDAAVAVLCIMASVAVKSNYVIFFAALFIYLILILIKKFDKRIAFFLLAAVLAVASQASIVKGATALLSGHKVGPGFSNYSYIAMGLQESDRSFDGWWNAYNRESYFDNNCDTKAQEAANKAYIKDRMKEFLADPKEAVSFFAGKEASQWNDPEFQGLWINRIMDHGTRYPRYLNSLMSEKGSYGLTLVFGVFQFLVLGGAVLYVCFAKKKNDISFLFGTILLGGFLFHTFWEAKAQYTLPYFMLLIPLAVWGYEGVFSSRLFADGKISVKGLTVADLVKCGIIGVLALAAMTGLISPLNGLIAKDQDTARYHDILSGSGYERLPDGLYGIREESAAEGNTVYLAFSAFDNGCLSFTEKNGTIIGYLPEENGKSLLVLGDEDWSAGYRWLLKKDKDTGNYTVTSVDGRYLAFDKVSGEYYLSADAE